MRLIATHRLQSGAKLARDVETGREDAVPLVRRGVELDDRYRRMLLDAGVHAIWVDDELGEGIEANEILSPKVRHATREAVDRSLLDARGAMQAKQPLPQSVISDLTQVAQMIAQEIDGSPDIAVSLCDLATADAYTQRHSANVAALGVLIGRRVLETDGWIDAAGQRRKDRREWRLVKLGLGLLLHDIGKLAVPDEILNKPGKLTPEEWELMRSHPEAGAAMLSDGVSPLVKDIVRSHHERWDGSGYPDGKSGRAISQLSRIAAIADTFDAMTSNRPYKEGVPQHEGVREIRSGSGKLFDPSIVNAFTRVVMPYPPGTEVPLPDGRTAVVVDVHPARPERLTVRIGNVDGWRETQIRLPDFALAA